MGKPAARVGDMHTCPLVNPGPTPHVGGPVLPPGGVTVLIGGPPAARVGDMATCVGPPDTIAVGSFTVLIEGKPAARLGDQTAHGGVIVMGFPTVLIGGSAQAVTLKSAAETGVPFCEECAAAAKTPSTAPPPQGSVGDQQKALIPAKKPSPKIIFKNATADQQNTITAAHNKAIDMANRAIARLEKAKTTPDPLVEEYFGIKGTEKEDQEKLKKLIKNYKKISTRLNQKKTKYTVEKCKESDVIAYVNNIGIRESIAKRFGLLKWCIYYGGIHICSQRYFGYGEQERAAIIAHEMSHYAVKTEDYAYENESEFKWMTQEEKMDNADSYGCFARDA